MGNAAVQASASSLTVGQADAHKLRLRVPSALRAPARLTASVRPLMSCILRISGNSLDVDALLSSTPLVADRAWKRGGPRIGNSGRLHADSGANFLVSNADIDAPHQQVVEAIAFLELHLGAVKKLANAYGVEQATLDFGTALLEGSVAAFFNLPPALVQLAAQANIGIEVSSYLCSEPSVEEGGNRDC